MVKPNYDSTLDKHLFLALELFVHVFLSLLTIFFHRPRLRTVNSIKTMVEIETRLVGIYALDPYAKMH